MIGSVDKPSTKAKEQKPKVNSAKAYHRTSQLESKQGYFKICLT